MNRIFVAAFCMGMLCSAAAGGAGQAGDGLRVTGWLEWRGPHQDGISSETGLPDRWRPGGENHLWDVPLQGRGTAVIASGGGQDRLYVCGYRGETQDLREVLVCADPATGKIHWERSFADFISDIIYNRYSIGAPVVDPETGNIYMMTSPGLLICFDGGGRILWQHSMMEKFGRLTFPNGRTGAPSIEGDLVIVNAITTNWGKQGPARNRFYAFHKKSSQLVWVSTPGVGPPFLKDSSFSSPVFEWRDRMRVFYAGTGCGNIVCVNARTGEPLWRVQMSHGGVNSTPAIHGDKLIAIHGKENIDDTGRGRMIAIDLKKAFASYQAARAKDDFRPPLLLDRSHELWRNNDLSMFTSSPVIVDDRIYQVTASGELFCLDVDTGRNLWHEKLGADQLHASPLFADGKLYIPTWHDGFYIIKPTDEGPQILDKVELDGLCIGSPSLWKGRIYLHTTSRLYCFGRKGGAPPPPEVPQRAVRIKPTSPARLQIVPSEILLRPGQKVGFSLRAQDSQGQDHGPVARADWEKFVPPAAKVVAYLDASVNDQGELVAGPDASYSAGAFRASAGTLKGTIRGRILPSPPYGEDFESFKLSGESKTDQQPFGFPPLPWIGARFKWEVTDLDGNKVLAKTLDRALFQRSTVFLGHPDDANYTIEADVMTDGNRRIKSDVGLVNQRYLITLRGNNQRLEVSSNHDRLKVSVPFKVRQKIWYRLKTRVDLNPDGSGVVRARLWPRTDGEPDAWTIEVEHHDAHRQGSPGLFGFSPQSQKRVYIDNVSIKPND